MTLDYLSAGGNLKPSKAKPDLQLKQENFQFQFLAKIEVKSTVHQDLLPKIMQNN